MGLLMSGYLPGQEMQGLSPLEAQLLAEPDKKIIAIVVLEQVSLTESRIDPSRDPTLTLRIQMLEPCLADDAPKADEMLRRLRADRLGGEQLDTGPEGAPAPEPAGRAARTAKQPRGRRRGLSSVPQT